MMEKEAKEGDIRERCEEAKAQAPQLFLAGVQGVAKEPETSPTEAEGKSKRLVDVTGGGDMAGEAIIIQELLDDDVLVTGFKRRESQFEGHEFYLAIQVQRGGDLYVFTTGSGPILDIFARLDPQALPLYARFIEKKGKKGRKYYTIV